MQIKSLAVAIAAITLAGCSTFGGNTPPPPVTTIEDPLEQTPDIAKAEAEILTATGTVIIEFTEEGEWIKIKSTAVAPINFNHQQGRDDAFNVAGMRAKRSLAEFLSNSVTSNKVTESLTKTTLHDVVTNGNKQETPRTSVDEFDINAEEPETSGGQFSAEDRKRASKIVSKVQSTISDSSTAVLRGAYVAERTIDRENNLAVVTVQASRKSINAAGTIRSLMSGL